MSSLLPSYEEFGMFILLFISLLRIQAFYPPSFLPFPFLASLFCYLIIYSFTYP